MEEVVTVSIHRSQFPTAVREALLKSVRARTIDPRFHYDGTRQTLRWLAMHEALSPSRLEPACRRLYEDAFDFLARTIGVRGGNVIGLGCGGGWKEAELLKRLHAAGQSCVYFPVDVSLPMVLVAAQAARAQVPACECHPLVLDLSEVEDLAGLLGDRSRGPVRLITAFGLLPNFEPQVIGRRLGALLRRADVLALSANLAPGPDYRRAVESVLPQYDNPQTRAWLMGVMRDLGFEAADGALHFKIERGSAELGLWRIVADFVLARPTTVAVDAQAFRFATGESIRVFFSYRYTPETVRRFLAGHGLSVSESWLSPHGEEGVFVCRRKSGPSPGRGRAGAIRPAPAGRS